jgi:hypothetical protein
VIYSWEDFEDSWPFLKMGSSTKTPSPKVTKALKRVFKKIYGRPMGDTEIRAKIRNINAHRSMPKVPQEPPSNEDGDTSLREEEFDEDDENDVEDEEVEYEDTDEEFNECEEYAMEFLTNFLTEMIDNHEAYKIDPNQLISLSRALILTETFKKFTFDRKGFLMLSATREYSNNGSLESYLVEFYENEIIFSMEEYVTGPSGGDSIAKEIYTIGHNAEINDIDSILENWKGMFMSYIKSSPGLEIEDDE